MGTSVNKKYGKNYVCYKDYRVFVRQPGITTEAVERIAKQYETPTNRIWIHHDTLGADLYIDKTYLSSENFYSLIAEYTYSSPRLQDFLVTGSYVLSISEDNNLRSLPHRRAIRFDIAKNIFTKRKYGTLKLYMITNHKALLKGVI